MDRRNPLPYCGERILAGSGRQTAISRVMLGVLEVERLRGGPTSEFPALMKRGSDVGSE